jgi:HSP20 family molecular chaperone IbpA
MSVATHEVAPRAKREHAPAEERTEAGRTFSPHTDIHETEQAVVVSMEMPGVDKSSIDIRLDKGVLTVKGTVDAARYESLRPIYSEFNVGNYVRTFTVSTKIDSARISATVADGVLTLELPKAAESVAKRITVT